MKESRLKIALLADAGHVNIQRWCEGLTSAGADLHVLSFRPPASDLKQCHNLPVPELPFKLHYFASVLSVRRLIKKIQPHLMVAYYVTGYGTLGVLSNFHPLVLVTSGSDVLVAPESPIFRRLLRFSLGRADLVTAWAPHMAGAARELGVSEDRLLVLPRGIPTEQFARARCPQPVEGDEIRIISTRSLKEGYNLDRLIRALHLLRGFNPACRLTLAGDGPQRDELMELARSLNLEDHVRFAGFVSNDQLPGLLSEHNAYVSIIDSDGVSASLLEAMASGLLPIVPNNPANSRWINSGLNGRLMDSISPSDIAQAISSSATDLLLRQRAWQENLDIVRRDADLFRNSERFVEQFQQLVSNFRKISNDKLALSSL